jgi:hypothetical protein
VFDTMRYKYPWLINCKVIFLDVMAPIAAVLTTVGRFFEKVYTERFQLAKSSDWAAADPDLKVCVCVCVYMCLCVCVSVCVCLSPVHTAASLRLI